MRYCPFCESPSVKWPEYASDYVRGYPLCEYHMGLALSTAKVCVYDEEKVARSERIEKLYKAVIGAINKEIVYQAKEMQPALDFTDAITLECVEYADGVAREALEIYDLFNSVEKPTTDYGMPVRVYIDESELDRWMTMRLKTLARRSDGDVYRCTAKYESKPDGRCTNFAATYGGLCKACQSKSVDLVHSINSAAKLDKIMRIMKDG